MAEKRMFSKTIIDSDAFLDMPLSSQALYFHLSMRADDDGFLNNAKKITRIVGANQNDYDLLLLKGFIIPFDDGICVIKHWRIHNYIRSDRYKPTVYQDEKSRLYMKDNKAYTLEPPKMDTVGIPSDNHLEPQIRLDKNSIDKNRLDKDKQQLLEEKDNDCSSGLSIADVFITYQNEIGLLSPTVSDTFTAYKNDISPELMILAIKTAVKSNARRLSYIEGIFKNWINEGIHTVEELKVKELERSSTKKNELSKSVSKKVEKFNTMYSHEWDFDEIERLEREYIDRMLEGDKNEQ